MKLKLLLSTFFLSISICSFAQDNRKAFAITGNGGDFQWMNIRQIDLSSGDLTKNIFENGKTNFSIIDAITNKSLAHTLTDNEKLEYQVTHLHRSAPVPQSPTATMVAAAAYHKKHDKLFFTPMFINELRWLDLSSNAERPKFYTLQTPLLNLANAKDEANHITRMTIGADGNGYALTNDGNHLIKFTTGKKVVITDLGALVDASANNNISVHNKCSSWGGDMIADALGNLYLFTAGKNVFKINVKNKIATYLGSITGLSGVYTLNGAAVDDDDHVIISSANTFEGFFRVNIKDLTATKLNTSGKIFNASDLANGNLLFASQVRNTVGVAPFAQREVTGNQFISVYPNPVSGSQFKVTFDKPVAGEHNIVLTDVQGKVIMSKQVFVRTAGQAETIQMKTKPASGMYLIKVTNAGKRSVFADKIVLE